MDILLQCVPKMRLVQSWISYIVVSLLQWNLARDILMTLAIKRIHNLPPHLSYVSTLPDVTQILKRDIDEIKHWRLEPYSSGHHRQSHWPVANTAACTHKGKGTSLRTPTVICPHNRLFSEPLTCQIGSFQSHSHYWEEDNINFRFLSRVSTLTRDIDIAILSVCLSVRDAPVSDENGLTHCHSFFYRTVAQSF